MREIKFRAWDKINKKICDVLMIEFQKREVIICTSYDVLTDEFYYELRKFIDIELIQYTGLKDKNGKEIYEGDTIKTGDGNIGVVEYHSYNDCGFSIVTSKGCYSVGYTYYGKMQQEIIGNIYENPELLREDI